MSAFCVSLGQGKYKFMENIDYQTGFFNTNFPERQVWQHVSMLVEDNGPQKFVFVELCYSQIEGEYVFVRHSILDPNEPDTFKNGCGMCYPARKIPHPTGLSKYVAGHWQHIPGSQRRPI